MLQRFTRQRSIRHQLITIFMVVCATVLMVFSVAFVASDFLQFRVDMRRELSTQARMVLENSTAALSFDDRATAQETMQTLFSNEHIRLACLYDVTGALFAQLRSTAEAGSCPAAAPSQGYTFTSSDLQVTETTRVAGRPAGSLYLRSDLTALNARLHLQVLTTIVLFAVVLALGLALSSFLQRIVSTPVAELAATARAVTLKGDYSLRAKESTSDELNLLVEAFNDMLEEIQEVENTRVGLLRREQEVNRLKDEFLMTLSHELRTPLNAILGWTRMLSSHLLPPEEAPHALTRIEQNALAQTRLVEDLLDVSRLTTGQFRIEHRPLNFVAVVNEAIDVVRPDADAKHIKIERRFSDDELSTVGDAERLRQVAWNLLSNAVKFSSDGGVITVALRREHERDELKVEDKGAGIEPGFLPVIFDPFRQADASSSRAHGGLGLGLSIARRIAQMHNGDVTAASPGLGRGATFTVSLPVVRVIVPPATGAPSWAVAAVPHSQLAHLDVLIVDDDGDSRELLVALLEASGAQVQSAASVAEALRLSAVHAPDAVISDIAMPGQDGYALLSRMKESLGPSMPRVTIALTARAGHADEQRALSAGFQRHLAKPFDPAAVVKALEDMSGRSNT